MADDIKLTPEQEEIVRTTFQGRDEKNPPSITELTQLAFHDPNIDGRSKEGRAIKKFLLANNFKFDTKTDYKAVGPIVLTEANKDFIRANKDLMTPVELARVLFADNTLTNLSVECRTLTEFLKTLTNSLEVQAAVADVPLESYTPPKSVEGVLKRVDKYVYSHGIQKDSLTAQQKAGLENLLAYVNNTRFVHWINVYETQIKRELFESSFVRYCYDKPDLTQEEVDQYMNVAGDNVALATNQARSERLGEMLDNVTAQTADERARISMSLVEAIGQINTEGNQIAKRQKDLLGDLKQKRSDRIAQLRSANASILNLVQLWKEEKSRKKLLHLGDARKKLLERSAGELSTMEEIKARIMGLDVNYIVNG